MLPASICLTVFRIFERPYVQGEREDACQRRTLQHVLPSVQIACAHPVRFLWTEADFQVESEAARPLCRRCFGLLPPRFPMFGPQIQI